MQGNGAGAIARKSVTVQLKNGKHVQFGQLVIKDFLDLREEARNDYVRGVMATSLKNLDMFPPEDHAALRNRALEKAESITVDSLPKQKAWVAKRDVITGKIVRHRGQRFRHEPSGQWVEDGAPLLEEEEIDYAGWWQSQTRLGQLHVLLRSIRRGCPAQEHWTLDDVIAAVGEDDQFLDEAANTIGILSAPTLGNAEAPAAVAAGAA